jgi:hypothetical protein
VAGEGLNWCPFPRAGVPLSHMRAGVRLCFTRTRTTCATTSGAVRPPGPLREPISAVAVAVGEVLNWCPFPRAGFPTFSPYHSSARGSALYCGSRRTCATTSGALSPAESLRWPGVLRPSGVLGVRLWGFSRLLCGRGSFPRSSFVPTPDTGFIPSRKNRSCRHYAEMRRAPTVPERRAYSRTS